MRQEYFKPVPMHPKSITFGITKFYSSALQVAGWAIITLLLLSACRQGSSIALNYTNAQDEVPQLGNLVFRFSGTLVPDSLLNRWDSTPYIKFKPAIPGRFRWQQSNELVFSPAAPLAPATSYTASFNEKAITGFAAGKSLKTDKDLRFYTPNLTLQDVQPMWTRADGAGAALLQLEAQFNYPVAAEALAEKLTVQVDGKKANFTVVSSGKTDRVQLRLAPFAVEDRDYKLNLQVAKGIVPEGGSNGMPQTAEQDFIMPSPLVLTIQEVTANHDGERGTISVHTSQPLEPGQLASFIRFDNAIRYTAEPTDFGMVITSAQFNPDAAYQLTFNRGLRGQLGGTLREDYGTPVAFGSLEPSLSFDNSKAVYLAAKGHKNIAINITNIQRVKVVVSKIYENNLLPASEQGYYPREQKASQQTNEGEEGEYEEDYYYYGYDGGNYTLGDVIYEAEIDTRTLPKLGHSRLFQFNIDDQLKTRQGIYHIKVRSTKDYWIDDSRLISLSDIGLIARQGSSQMWVWASSLQTAEPMAGVQMAVYGKNNQLLGNGTTAADGSVAIALPAANPAGFMPALVVAKTDADFNYLPLQSTQINLSRFETGGRKPNPSGLDAYLYAERDIYRPGETIHFASIVRSLQGQNAGVQPVWFRMLMPNGKELTQQRKTLNEQGGTDGDITLSPAALTGTYVLEMYNGADVLLATKNFKVETFMPDRLKLNLTLSQPSLQPGSSTQLSMNAQQYFGPPAANRRYEAEIQIKEKPFAPKAYAQYQFELANAKTFFDKILRQGTTSAEGQASEAFTVPEAYRYNGLLQARFFATVFDETGRPVSRNTSADIFTQSSFLGIGNNGYSYFPLNQTIQFPLIALNAQEKPIAAAARVKIIKVEYRTVLSKSGEYFRYQSQRGETLLEDKALTIQGNATSMAFVPRSPGEYEIRLYQPGAGTYVKRSFYSYGAWGNSQANFEVNTDGEIDIAPDREQYNAGDKARLLFKAPFDGQMLVTLEAGEVISHQRLKVTGRAASLELPLQAAAVPNVYVTATLIKPHAESSMPLTVAHGYKRLPVADEARRLAVQITVPEKSRSRLTQTVTVKTTPGAMVTLAGVDNGVLAVSNFPTPDPYQYYQMPRALSVQGYDLYPLLFPELRRTLSSTGGDADLEMNLRMNPMPDKRVKLLSYWSGTRQAGSNGQLSFEVPIPAFSGQVRWMAVAYKEAKCGAAEATTTVADPLVISAGLPRFASPGDSLLVPVTITNTTAKAIQATATLQAEGALAISGQKQQAISIGPNAEGVAHFALTAPAGIGSCKLRIQVQGGGEKMEELIELAVRPPSTLQKRYGAGTIPANGQAQVAINTSGFIPATTRYTLSVGRSPLMELGSVVQYLVDYPYGCTEQTISTAFPQLYVADLGAGLPQAASLRRSAVENVEEAIRKIKMRQLYNGGIMLWDGQGTENWWATAYAAHFVLEAQKAGYQTDKSLLDNLLAYLNMRLRTRSTVAYTYNRTQVKRIAPKEVAYSLYVLALARKPNQASMNYYKTNNAELALDSRYLLAAAYALAGDKKSFATLLPNAFNGEEAEVETGGSFSSPIRDEGVALNALLEADPNHPQIPAMANNLSRKLKARTWYSTQEAAFALTALGKLAKKTANSNTVVAINAGGKNIAAMEGATIALNQQQLSNPAITVQAKGNQPAYYWWQSSGISADGSFAPQDQYLKIRRNWYTRNGQPIGGNQFTQGDLIVVQLILEKSFNGPLDNVVVTDLLPAGFEIENPRIKDLPGTDWIKDATNPLHMDVRDDRIHFFTNLTGARQIFYYTVRAVSPGRFVLGPASADAMYNGSYFSYHGAGTVVVKGLK